MNLIGKEKKARGRGGSRVGGWGISSSLSHLCNPPPRVSNTPKHPKSRVFLPILKYVREMQLAHLGRMGSEQAICRSRMLEGIAAALGPGRK